jgi:2-methylcitrate dehydratase PrpD
VNSPLAKELAVWTSGLRFEDIPDDVVAATRLRVLDVIGLALAGAETEFGRSVRATALVAGSPGPCRILGTGDGVGVTAAALANGAFPQALEFDDTHNESIVHMSSPAVAAALALSEVGAVSGKDLITAVALANEVSCRVGVVSAGEFHRRGFHPTGLFAPFGVTSLACRLLGLDVPKTANAAGMCGSFSAGLLECWVDGTQTKFVHSGWAAQSGVMAAYFAQAGLTGPAAVFEGRFGLFASHVQDPGARRDFSRITDGLGSLWDSRNASFKPFPAAHVIHPYIDALLRLRTAQGIRTADVESIECPVAAFIVPIVCEPLEEKLAPLSDSHGRVSLQYTLAEAFHRGELGKKAYAKESLRNPEILALAKRVRYRVDPEFPGPGRFKGAVEVRLKDGRVFSEVEEHNRGSAQNPMTYAELRAKFDENAGGFLSKEQRDRLADSIGVLETLSAAKTLVDLAVGHPEGVKGE